MSLEIMKAGPFTSIQDLGRFHYQDQGVNVGGVMDSFSARLANWLVGNDENEAVMEMSMLGPTISFKGPQIIALAGSDLGASLNDQPLLTGRPIYVRSGSVLTFKGPVGGRYGYLAIRSGIDLEKVLGSYATNTRTAFGGFKGRILADGDLLSTRQSATSQDFHWSLPDDQLAGSGREIIRITRGPEWGVLPPGSSLCQDSFIVTTNSDRMGYRLQGQLPLGHKQEMISSGVTFGTIQLPADGLPIVLMADRQTIGGYPRIANVISADLPLLAQALPGEKIFFQEVSVTEAQSILFEKLNRLQILKAALFLKWRG